MSFDLAAWTSPSPVTVAEAAAEHERLCATAAAVGVDAPHPAVAAFHRALTDLHPDLTAAALAADERAEASPWSELSLTASAVLVAVSWRRAEEIAALVGELAAQHGLTLYDPQRRTVRSPVGAAPTPVGRGRRRRLRFPALRARRQRVERGHRMGPLRTPPPGG